MRATSRLLQQSCKIVLFTRANCSLCDDAKLVLSRVWERRPFEYKEIDVMKPEEKQWRNNYEFDVPVIHVDKLPTGAQLDSTISSHKLMHRFTDRDVERLMSEAEARK